MSISLSDQRAAAIKAARDIVETAKSGGRTDLNPNEVEQVERHLSHAKTIDKQLKGKALVDSVLSLGSVDDDDGTDPFGGPHSSVFDPEAAKGLVSAIRTRSNYRTTVSAKAALTGGTLLPPAGQGLVPGLFPNGVVVLSSLFPNEAATSPTVRYYQFDSATAGIVAEGAAKPDAGLTIAAKDAVLKKIATTSQVSDELSEDAPAMLAAIAAELQAAVAVSENTHVVSQLLGASGILVNTATAATLIDVLADEVANQTAINGVVPSAVILHPTQLATLRKSRASTSGVFNFDPLSAAPASVHGVPLVPTPSTAAATVLVVAGRAATFYRRGPVTVELGTNATDWVMNTRTMRVEERVVLAVQRPSMVSKVTVS